MKLRILSVGHKMPAWVETACSEYTKRMPRECLVEIVDIKPDKRSDTKSEAVQLAESKRILDIAGKDFLVVCDEHGAELSTMQLADKLQIWQAFGKNISLIIGGADGLHKSLIQRADFCWSLSKLTLPHAFVRLLLAEQLYRAHTILIQHPYHKE